MEKSILMRPFCCMGRKMSDLKWLEQLESRYLGLRPVVRKPEDFNKLNDFEKSYFMDLQRLIDETKQLHSRQEDFRWIFSQLPDHPLLKKIMNGRITAEEKEEWIRKK